VAEHFTHTTRYLHPSNNLSFASPDYELSLAPYPMTLTLSYDNCGRSFLKHTKSSQGLSYEINVRVLDLSHDAVAKGWAWI
jgi:hypothetical protein